MVIQIFVLYYCTVMLSLSRANCSSQSVSYCSMPDARSSIQPEMMLISKIKKRSAHEFVTRIHVLNSCHEFVTRQNILEVRERIKIF